MGRVKIAPTPRAAALNDAMRKAATQISPPTAETMLNDLASTSKLNKPTTKNSLPTPRGSQDRASSEPAAKRKASSDNSKPPPAFTKDTKLALRSSTRAAAAANGNDAEVDSNTPVPEGPRAKRQRIDEASQAPRRSARAKANQDSTPLAKAARAPVGKSKKKVDKPPIGRSSNASESQKRPELGDDSSQVSEADEDETGTAIPQTLEPVTDSFPSPTSAITDPQLTAAAQTQFDDIPPRDTMSLPPTTIASSSIEQLSEAAAHFASYLGDQVRINGLKWTVLLTL
jgi:hypothetical protein